MNIIKMSLHWIKLTIQKMRKFVEYSFSKSDAIYFMEMMYHWIVVTKDSNNRYYLGDLSDYFIQKDAVTLTQDKTRLDFKIGDYHFFIESYINVSHPDEEIIVRTYEIIKQPYRWIPPCNESVCFNISNMDIIKQKGDRNWNIRGIDNDVNNPVIKEYCKRLMQYLERIEIKEAVS